MTKREGGGVTGTLRERTTAGCKRDEARIVDWSVHMYRYMYVEKRSKGCCEGEERQGETDTQRGRQTETDNQRPTDRQRYIGTDRLKK